MCKRKLPKYKIGDIIEYWYEAYKHGQIIDHFLIVDIRDPEQLKDRYRKFYYLKSLKTGNIAAYTIRTVDMRHNPRHNQLYIEGFRKVG